ncbi:hypothetical protein B0H14DRAFT_2651581 [Mycena olivaceomarginata]|nr:hypothetical protein B0H14DRAFT_2651581 [Mycena olivaceomarginata]
MSGSGATYYDEELKYLYRLVKNLPDVIPEGNAHDFTNYVPDPQRQKTSAAQKLGGTPSGETITVSFKLCGPPLEKVVTVLRHHITGNGGMNLLLTKWVDNT